MKTTISLPVKLVTALQQFLGVYAASKLQPAPLYWELNPAEKLAGMIRR